ncbi:MAG: HD domain-containing protein [Verrucomicrobiota bacterium]
MSQPAEPLDRLHQQIAFIREIDRLKAITRRSLLFSKERFENSAEHSWHIAILSMVLAEYAGETVDTMRVVRMLLIHDIVEIDAGDVFIYDEIGQAEKAVKEDEAFERIFGLLPDDQRLYFRKHWDEFENGESAEARFARAIDRMMPLLHNVYTDGAAWKAHKVKPEQVYKINRVIEEGSPKLWAFVKSLIDDCVSRGLFEHPES